MKLFYKKGFTLVELLIVIAVLGTLAVVVLIALNPVQQLARTRDAGRSSAVAQVGHAIEAYATVNNGQYVAHGGGCATAGAWVQNCLVASGEIQVVPSTVAYSALSGGVTGTCGGVVQNGLCYEATTLAAVIYTEAEALANRSKCNLTGGEDPYFVYSTAAGRGGLWCGGSDPAPGLLGTDSGWRN